MQSVKYSQKEQKIVDAFNGLPDDKKISTYWSQDEAKHVRDFIKDFYIAEQAYRCCYCRRQTLSSNKGDWQREHIIPRGTHASFMFEPLNLAICCRECNLEKSDKNVLKNSGRTTFPKKSADYIIVHPHFDEYDEHIRWFGLVCAPRKSEKGRKTIEICGLLRFAAEFSGIDTDINDRRFDDSIGELMVNSSKLAGTAVLASLKVYVDNLTD